MDVLFRNVYSIVITAILLLGLAVADFTGTLVVDKSSAVVYLPFDTVTDGEFKDGTNVTNTLHGTAQTVAGKVDQALSLDGQTAISLGEGRDECFMDPEQCTNGFTLAFWVLNVNRDNSQKEPYLMSSGAQTATSWGIHVLLETGSHADDRGLIIGVTTRDKRVSMTDTSWLNHAKDGVWMHMAIVFHNEELVYYENGTEKWRGSMSARDPTITESEFNQFALGAPNNHLTTQSDQYWGVAYLDELLFWDSHKDGGFILNLYHSYYDTASIPTCDMNVKYVEGTCVISCKDMADGSYQACVGCNVYIDCASEVLSVEKCSSGTRFDRSQEACIQSSSTCTGFDATDKCTPQDPVSSSCSLIVDKSTAAVWMPFDTVTDGEFSDGTLRTNTLHGTAQTVDGKDGQAMVLDGNTVLSVGDWRHACFWNPEKCDSGFTVAFWMYNIKRNNDDESPYIISNGGQTSYSFGITVLAETGAAEGDRGLLILVSTKGKRVKMEDTSWSANAKDDMWTHLAITFQNEVMKYYENGTKIFEGSMEDRNPVLISTEFNKYLFGAPNRNYETPSSYWGQAYVDDYIAWDSSKDDAFISNLYNSYGNPSFPGCNMNLKCVDGSCWSTCVGQSDGSYQSCVGCNVFVNCTSGELTHHSCRSGTQFDTSEGSCVETSTTCTGSDASAQCLPNGCSDSPCGNSGVCSMTGTGWSCDCDTPNSGYSGPTCEVVSSYCTVHSDDDVCNGGTCSDESNGQFSCDCLDGYKGQTCDTETYCKQNENNTAVCMNGGTCVDAENLVDHSCQCTDGYTGDNCQTETFCKEHEDNATVCMNGGTCVDAPNKVDHSCQCAEGYTGNNCQTGSFCRENPSHCENGGDCVDGNTVSFVRCDCAAGYSGETCSREDLCVTSNPCQNSGQCSSHANGTTECACAEGFVGDTCSVADPCASNPCQNEGNCDITEEGGTYGYRCNCTQHFSGTNCQTGKCQSEEYADRCAGVNCVNQQDGTCHVPEPVLADIPDNNGSVSVLICVKLITAMLTASRIL